MDKKLLPNSLDYIKSYWIALRNESKFRFKNINQNKIKQDHNSLKRKTNLSKDQEVFKLKKKEKEKQVVAIAKGKFVYILLAHNNLEYLNTELCDTF